MKTLNDIQGQQRAVSLLKRQLDSGRLAHAYLFVGPDGSGKTTTALAFAKALMCSAGHGGCGTCSSCRRADEGLHPDIHLVERGEETADIKVGQIRKLLDELALTPFEAQHKAAIVDDAERLNPEASNAFLKTLEEPSAGTVLILVAADKWALLDTVVSRCRMIRFRALPDDVIHDILISQGVDAEKADAASALAAGNVKRALSLVDSDLTEERRWLIENMPALKEGNPVELTDELLSRCPGKALAQTRERVATYLGFLALLMRDVRITQCGVKPARWYSGDSLTVVRQLASKMTERGACTALADIEQCRREIASNVKLDLSLTKMFVSIMEVLA